MKKVLFVPGNTDLNRGDQALVWESINLITDLLGKIDVYLYNAGSNKEEEFAQKKQTMKFNYSFIDRILKHPRSRDKSKNTTIHYNKLKTLKWSVYGLVDLISTILLLIPLSASNRLGEQFLSSEQKKAYHLFDNLDYLVVKGGGFLHSYGKLRDLYVMYFFVFDILLANRKGIEIIILPNSIGPMENRLAKRLVRYALSKATFVSVREEISDKFVKEDLNLDSHLYPDLGFYLSNTKKDINLDLQNLSEEKINIAITLRPYRFDGSKNPEKLYRNYITQIASLVENLSNRNYKISFVAHTLGPSRHEDDRLAINDVLNILDSSVRDCINYIEDEDFDCIDLQYLYSKFDIVIGTRFHSVIFALNEFVPSIAIAYGGNKSYGIMKEIGVSEFVMPIEKVNALKLEEMVETIISNNSSYQQKIKTHRKELTRLRFALIDDIKKLL